MLALSKYLLLLKIDKTNLKLPYSPVLRIPKIILYIYKIIYIFQDKYHLVNKHKRASEGQENKMRAVKEVKVQGTAVKSQGGNKN